MNSIVEDSLKVKILQFFFHLFSEHALSAYYEKNNKILTLSLWYVC